MSLISDTDFLIHRLRLSYLRDVDDPYGARLITLDPSYTSNPYITAAALADPDRWPELAMPTSPHLSEDEGERPSGFPGARLKHTQTIMGGRTGGLGMRVNAKRSSISKRMSGTPQREEVKNFLSANAPVQEALSSSVPMSTELTTGDTETQGTSTSQPNVQMRESAVAEEAPVAKVVQFVPKFKGAAEMEARRRVRMAARRGPVGAPAQPIPQSQFIDSSDEEEDEEDGGIPVEDESSSDDEFELVAGGADEGDEFDPDFAATRTGINSDSPSSVLSGGTNSISASYSMISSHTHSRLRPRLSPVSESLRTDHRLPQPSDDRLFFEMLTPAPGSTKREGETSEPFHPIKLDAGPRNRDPPNFNQVVPSSPHPTAAPDMTFTRKPVAPLRTLKSALTAMLVSSGGSSNPFAEMYAAISGRGESASTNVQVYFPHARRPAGKAMNLNVRKDATVEEVVGFALWSYWEEQWEPGLDQGLNGEDDPRWETTLSAVGWIMRIAEEDGEVDDDFPPPDRIGKIAKFNSDAYAVLEATPIQIQQNQILESKIQRRPSRTAAAKKPEKLAVPGPNVPAAVPGSAVFGSTLGSLPLSTSLGPSSSHGPQIFLRIRVADTADAVHISTTIPVSAGMYMQEALELVCRKRKLANPKDYALLLADMSILIPLDRTVASLQGKRELLLVKRSMLPQIGGDKYKDAGRSTDPNASIFKRMSDTPEVQASSALDFTASYKKYTIYRKIPMLVARQERTLAIDGVYIHIMPSTSRAKAVFDNGKTLSFHIKSIADCQQSAKTSSTFKLVLNRKKGPKRYDFEAENSKFAAEIVQRITKAALERSGTVTKSRRSKHLG